MSYYNTILRWSTDAWFEWYEEPSNLDEWRECPVCDSKPRIWVSDNIRQAQCRCSNDFSKYRKRNISVESIGELARRTNGDISSYDRDLLRKAWNRYTEGGES